VSELQRAVNDCGGYTQAMEGLGACALRASRHPVILHVRRPGFHMPYAHWVLFLGVEGGKARIVDPPNSVQLMPFGELLALWDGVGLVVARKPVKTWPIRAAGWFEEGVFLLLVAIVIHAVRCAAGRSGLSARRLWPAVMLVSLSVFLALVGHLLHDEGFLRNPTGLLQVVGRHFKPELPSISVAEIGSMIGQPGVTFVDARLPRDYESGHLTGAINLPVYAGPVERAERLAAIGPANRLVVYCQSTSCRWGELIAADLFFRGYRNVSLFPGGWQEWQQHEKSKF
jgi:rhodanese-related sulfurtransferase